MSQLESLREDLLALRGDGGCALDLFKLREEWENFKRNAVFFKVNFMSLNRN
jgi:hypothetical protein